MQEKVVIRAEEDIQEALDSHAPGTIFYIEAGVWDFSKPLRLKSGQKIRGGSIVAKGTS